MSEFQTFYFQNEAKCKTCLVKMRFFCMRIKHHCWLRACLMPQEERYMPAQSRTTTGQVGFSIKFCHSAGIFMPKKQRAFPSDCKRKMNMALQKFAHGAHGDKAHGAHGAHGAHQYCNFKRTALQGVAKVRSDFFFRLNLNGY